MTPCFANPSAVNASRVTAKGIGSSETSSEVRSSSRPMPGNSPERLKPSGIRRLTFVPGMRVGSLAPAAAERATASHAIATRCRPARDTSDPGPPDRDDAAKQ